MGAAKKYPLKLFARVISRTRYLFTSAYKVQASFDALLLCSKV